MNVGARPALRALSLFVLGVLLAPIPLSGSTRGLCSANHYRHRAALARITKHRTFAAIAKAAAAPQLHVAPRIDDSFSPSSPADSIGRRLTGRIFVEDTTPSSFLRLQTAQVHLPLAPFGAPRIVSPAVRNSSVSVANRQRAP